MTKSDMTINTEANTATPTATAYDSAQDTQAHIDRVNELLGVMILELVHRGDSHDHTKLGMEEKPLFDIYTPKLKHCTYGSEEYKQFLQELQPALEHHYKHNRHHPEYHDKGIRGMTLIDIVEMLMDWLAASERHNNGDILKSIEINSHRFGYDNQGALAHIMRNTVMLFRGVTTSLPAPSESMGMDVSESMDVESRHKNG